MKIELICVLKGIPIDLFWPMNLNGYRKDGRGALSCFQFGTCKALLVYEKRCVEFAKKECKRRALMKIAMENNLPLDACWTEHRLKMFMRLAKKRQKSRTRNYWNNDSGEGNRYEN